MSSNQFLKELHIERLERQKNADNNVKSKPIKVDKSVGPDESFSCAVCYTDGSSSGLVTPTCCSHKICLDCYTKITIMNKEKASCPECRTLYIKKKDDEEEIDPYADMPPLISPHQLIYGYTFEEEAMGIINNAMNNINRNNIINQRI